LPSEVARAWSQESGFLRIEVASGERGAKVCHGRGILVGVRVAVVALQVHQDLHQLRGSIKIASPLEYESEVPAPACLSPSVADLATDGELLLKEVDGAVMLAEENMRFPGCQGRAPS
jgi:hypothetical protein